MSDCDLLVVAEEEKDSRLDVLLARRFPELSRTYFQYLIKEGHVLVNGEQVKKRSTLTTCDEIEVHFISTPEVDLTPEAIPLDILFEDDYLLVINKPAGLVVHPAPGNWNGTLVNGLLHYCKQLKPDHTLRPGIVHRLDKDTSGVLVAAKTNEMQQQLSALFANRSVYKAYWLICSGRPPEGEINFPIGRHPVHRQKMAVVENGRNALTICKNLGWDGTLSFVQAVIQTGRTHQIRVHMQHRGFPVLGDALYGCEKQNKRFGAARQLLHAAEIRFEHPITKELISCRAPPPADMQVFLTKMGI